MELISKFLLVLCEEWKVFSGWAETIASYMSAPLASDHTTCALLLFLVAFKFVTGEGPAQKSLKV